MYWRAFISPFLLPGAPTFEQEDNSGDDQNKECYSKGTDTSRSNLFDSCARSGHFVQRLKHLLQSSENVTVS